MKDEEQSVSENLSKSGRDSAQVSSLVKLEYESEKLEERFKELSHNLEGVKKSFKGVQVKQMELEDFILIQK